jgi:hypothetical protein
MNYKIELYSRATYLPCTNIITLMSPRRQQTISWIVFSLWGGIVTVLFEGLIFIWAWLGNQHQFMCLPSPRQFYSKYYGCNYHSWKVTLEELDKVPSDTGIHVYFGHTIPMIASQESTYYSFMQVRFCTCIYRVSKERMQGPNLGCFIFMGWPRVFVGMEVY